METKPQPRSARQHSWVSPCTAVGLCSQEEFKPHKRNHIKAQMTFTKAQKLSLTLTPTHLVRQWEIITQLWHMLFQGPFAVQIEKFNFFEFWRVSASWAAGSCILWVRPSSCSWRWICGPPQPFCTLPYSQVSGRNWKKPRPGIREIRARHCLQPGHGPVHHERVTHFFKILPQLLVFFVSLPFPALSFDTADLKAGL